MSYSEGHVYISCTQRKHQFLNSGIGYPNSYPPGHTAKPKYPWRSAARCPVNEPWLVQSELHGAFPVCGTPALSPWVFWNSRIYQITMQRDGKQPKDALMRVHVEHFGPKPIVFWCEWLFSRQLGHFSKQAWLFQKSKGAFSHYADFPKTLDNFGPMKI